MDQTQDPTLQLLQFLAANPLLAAGGVTAGYALGGLLLGRLLLTWANRSNAAGQEFKFHDALDKIYADTNTLGLAIVIGAGMLAIAHIVAAVIGG